MESMAAKRASIASAFGRKWDQGEHGAWLDNVMGIYERMRSRESEYAIEVGDLKLIVMPSVYAPCYFTDSLWYADVLPAVVRARSLLEIGCGTGIISLRCAQAGACVVATDVNPAAVKNARLNAEVNGIDLEVMQGSVYEPLGKEQRFDFIFWAHPFNNCDLQQGDLLLRSGFDSGYSDLRKYVEGARQHLATGGRLLLGSGDTADLHAVESIAADNGYSLRVLSQRRMPLEEGESSMVNYLLLEYEPTK
jgi:release factor glutamine methyltransferase